MLTPLGLTPNDEASAPNKREARQRFRDEAAPSLAAMVGGPTTRGPGAGGQLSQAFVQLEDDETLLIAAGETEGQFDVDLALAHGLHHAKDKKLVLLLPAEKAGPTQVRAAWFDRPLEVFGYSGHDSTPVRLATADLRPGGYVPEIKPDLRDVPWVGVLVQAINAYLAEPGSERLAEAHRKSYLAWHYRGRQVLRISRSKNDTNKNCNVIAGVNYSKPVPDQLPPISITVSGDPSAEMLELLRAAAVMAVKNRRDGRDIDNREHQLQEGLRQRHQDFKFSRMEREFPVLRPGGGRAYIDFLAIHENGSIHVVETKIGPDPMLVLQGLDYWIWVKTNMALLCERFDLLISPEIKIDFVVAEKNGLVSRYTGDQLSALKDEIPWRFHIVKNWRKSPETMDIATLPWKTPPQESGV